MADASKLFEDVKARKNTSRLLTADRFVKSVEACSEAGVCPTSMFDPNANWMDTIKQSESKLVHVSKMDWVKSPGKVSKGSCMDFDCVVTTTSLDRDGDILETSGAFFAKDAPIPFLWQHIPIKPIGKMIGIVEHREDLLKTRIGILDFDFGRDVAKMIEFGMLQISHGFDPTEYEPLEGDKGWHFKEFEIFEISGVSVPSNRDAQIETFTQKEFKPESEPVKAWRKSLNDAEKITGKGVNFEEGEDSLDVECSCKNSDGHNANQAAEEGEEEHEDISQTKDGGDQESPDTSAPDKTGFEKESADEEKGGMTHCPHCGEKLDEEKSTDWWQKMCGQIIEAAYEEDIENVKSVADSLQRIVSLKKGSETWEDTFEFLLKE